MLKTKLLDLKDHIFEWAGLTLYDDLYPALTHKEKDAPKIFLRLINEALRRYDQFYPVQMEYKLNGTILTKQYRLPDNNFELYLKGNIPEERIVLTPEQIYFIDGWLTINSQWWRFDEFTKVINFTQACQVKRISYFSNHPVVANFSPDGDFTEDSAIYFLDVWNDEPFRVFLMYYILRYIRNVNLSIDLQSNVQYFKNLDNIINDFKTDIDEFIETRSRIMIMWRK